jgi:hypothetical protein
LIDAVTERPSRFFAAMDRRTDCRDERNSSSSAAMCVAAQTYDSRSAKRDEFLDHLSDAFAKLIAR